MPMEFLNTKLFATILLTMMVVWAGCDYQMQEPEGDVIAKVGNDKLTREEAFKMIPEFMLKQDTAGALANYKQDWVRRRIILQEAERLELDQEPAVQRKLARARTEVLTQALKDQVLGKFEQDLNVSKSEAQDYYEAHKERFVLNERYIRFRHLVTNTLDESRQAKNDLMGGHEWRSVVEEYAVNKEQALQKSTQFWPISVAMKDNPPMRQYLDVIGVTEISPIRRVDDKFHFVQLMDQRSKGTHPDIDWLLDHIQDWLRLSKRRKHFNSYVQNLYLKADANNEIDMKNVEGIKQAAGDSSIDYSNIKSNYKDSLTN